MLKVCGRRVSLALSSVLLLFSFCLCFAFVLLLFCLCLAFVLPLFFVCISEELQLAVVLKGCKRRVSLALGPLFICFADGS